MGECKTLKEFVHFFGNTRFFHTFADMIVPLLLRERPSFPDISIPYAQELLIDIASRTHKWQIIM